MSQKKTPTNTDLSNQIKQALGEIKQMNHRIGILESKQLQEDAYRAALKTVKEEEEKASYENLRDGEIKKRTEILKQVGIIAGIIIAILYAYLSTHGIRTG